MIENDKSYEMDILLEMQKACCIAKLSVKDVKQLECCWIVHVSNGAVVLGHKTTNYIAANKFSLFFFGSSLLFLRTDPMLATAVKWH